MSIGASDCTLTLTRATRSLLAVGTNWLRQLVTLTLTGHTPTAAANLALFAYRGDTLVATATFTGSTDTATGSMDLYTTELEDLFDTVAFGGGRELTLRLWNADPTSLELIGSGQMPILCPGSAYSDDSGSDPVSPVTPSTIKVGIFAFYNGNTYGLNAADGLYYRLTFDGAGAQIHWHFEEAGISIP